MSEGIRALLCWVGIAIASSPALAAAQSVPDFSALRVKVGDRLYVTNEETGVEVNGPLEMISGRQLALDGYVFTPGPALTIERSGDSIWDGAAVGFCLGAFLLYPVAPETFVAQGGGFRLNNGLLWGAIGALIDYAHKGRTTIYKGSPHFLPRTARFVPQLDVRRRTVALAVAFGG
jgi:hypothetical protein